MSAKELLIEEIKHQPESVVRELLHYLQSLQRHSETEHVMEKAIVEGWEKLGPAPEVDYGKI